MRRRAALALVPLAVLSLLLVGCSDDDKKAATTTTERPDPSTAEDDSTTTRPDTTRPGTTAGDTTSSTTTAPGGPGPSGGNDDFCADFQALTGVLSGSPEETLEDVQASSVTFAEDSAALVAIAPADLADEMQVMADYFASLRDAVADATTREDVQTRVAGLATPEFGTAGDTLNAWVMENCP